MSAEAELSSVATALAELSQQLTRLTQVLTPTEDERYGADLAEIERVLGAARRRLQRITPG